MIRFANKEDIPRIMRFLGSHWKKDHILSYNRDLFEFQHFWEDEVTFVISDTEQGMNGILGFIPYDKRKRDVMLVTWKALKTDDAFLGIDMLEYLRRNSDIRTVSSPGINPKTIPIYQFLGFETGVMKQWYRLCKNAEYQIAKIKDYEIPPILASENAYICEINDINQVSKSLETEYNSTKTGQLRKSLDYIKRRYFEHPIYNYLKYNIEKDEKNLLVVLRIQEYGNSSILRVIDCIGDWEMFRFFSEQIDYLMDKYGCEYSDCYESGLSDEIFREGGWKESKKSGNITPDYFSPFEQRNVDIFYMSEIKNAVLFKGDGDMDRPS